MPVGRPKVNLASVRAQAAARSDSDLQPSADRRRRLGRLMVLGANILTIVLLSISFAPANQWFIAYVALVPWTLALVQNPYPRRAILWAGLGGLGFWVVNVYWLWWITLGGYAALAMYLSSMYWLVAAIILRAALKRNWPATLVLPVVWVALEYARNFIISGFPWLFLAQTQVPQPVMIQIADATGQYGVSFFVAMVNGLAVDLIRLWAFKEFLAPRQRVGRALAVSGATVLVTTGLVAYGVFRMGENTTVSTYAGPVIGVVQQAYPIRLGERGASSEDMQKQHILASQEFRGTGIELLVWPESMAERFINSELLDLDAGKLSDREVRGVMAKFDPAAWDKKYSTQTVRSAMEDVIVERRRAAEKIAALSRDLQCWILTGSAALHKNLDPIERNDQWVVGNGALLFDREWRNVGEYDKIHLVPFGEYVPFKHSWLWLHQTLRDFVPPAMEQIEPGDKYTGFEVTTDHKKWRIVTPICYEGTFDRVCRNLVYRDGQKAADVMVNISNDGWFVWPWQGWGGSTEQPQHLVQYCFRAVENRVPVVRAVNTGISASIDSCGRIQAVVNQYGKQDMVTGAMLLKDGATPAVNLQVGPGVRVDTRVTLYGRIGDVFAMVVSVLAAGMCVVLLVLWRREKRALSRGNPPGRASSKTN